jgi:energy-converting hydrogenase A subunit R
LTRVFVSDCEGPISKNDNAFEITAHFVPSGDKIFRIISRYDDVLADLVKRPGYRAGDTLKLILPFLKAYDLTDQMMKEFSSQNLVLVPCVKSALNYIRNLAPTYIVSTSYEHYIEALSRALNFPRRNTYCTRLRLDQYELNEQEKSELKQIGREIAEIPIFEIPREARRLEDLPARAETSVQRLDNIFWKTIAKMEIGEIYEKIIPMGGAQKAEALKNISRELETTVADLLYVGDSITDVEAFSLVKKSGGLAVSFNGNQYAVQNADISLISPDSAAIAVILQAFACRGKKETLDIVANWNRETLDDTLTDDLKEWFFKLHPNDLPKAKIVTKENMKILAEESGEFRKRIRGEAVGRLG